jgi:hypothetical protein
LEKYIPIEAVLDEHDELIVDPSDVINFIKRWGMVGRLSNLFDSEMYEQFQPIGIKTALPPHEWATERLARDIFPYDFAIDELFRLARCARLVLNLLRVDQKTEEFKLTKANRKRIVSGWGYTNLSVPDNRDPATFKPIDDAWISDFIYLDVKQPVLSWAEIALDEFAEKMNQYLEPLTRIVFRVDKSDRIYLGKHGLETAFATYLLSQISAGAVPKECLKCHATYFPQRNRADGKYCSIACGANERQQRWRESNKRKVAFASK